jgi:adenylate cyclase
MSSVASGPAGRLRLPRVDLARLLRGPALKAIVGAHLMVAAIILARGFGWLQPFELLIYDALRVAWAGLEPSNRIFVVGATEDDIADFDWPLRDGLLADLLERLASWNPQAIGVDIYRDRPEPPDDKAGTERLAAVLARHKEIVWVFKLQEGSKRTILPPAMLRGTERAVLADFIPDPGNVIRRALLYAGDDNSTAMGMELALRYLAANHIRPGPAEGDDIRLGKALIAPLDDTRGPYTRLDSNGYQILLDYHGGLNPFPIKSIGDIMRGADAASLVRGRVVIVGVHAESVHDSFSAPFNTGFNREDQMNGIIVHAHVADQLIREAMDGVPILDGFPRHVEDLWIWAWAMAGMALGLLIRYTISALIVSAVGLLVLAGIVYGAFGAAVLLPACPAAIAWMGSAGLTNRVMYVASNRARTLLRKSFEHYLPPAVIEQMLAAGTLPELGGHRREFSVLFTDVAGFTTTAESMDPEFLATVCSFYFEGVCAAVFKEGGMVNEFVGDAVLAFFGAPHEQADHADRAVSAAMAIDEFAQRFSAEQKARGVNFGHTRIGVHTGTAMVGNIGTRARLKYGAQGDMLNAGARLDGLNKTVGTRILASGDTVRKTLRHTFRPVGTFVVKGRQGGTEVFEPLDPRTCDAAWADRYRAAFGALEADRPEAAPTFEALHHERPDDPCVAFHCRRLGAGETGTVIVMTEK